MLKVEGLTGDPQRFNTQNAYFQLDNRGKRSLSIDLKTEEGRAILLRLLDDADVFVTSIRPPGLARLGLDPDSVAARCRASACARWYMGYGLDGPAADKAGYDIGAFWSRVPGWPPRNGRGPSLPCCGRAWATTLRRSPWSPRSVRRCSTASGRAGSAGVDVAGASGAWVVSSDLAAHMAGEHPEPGLKRALYPLSAATRRRRLVLAARARGGAPLAASRRRSAVREPSRMRASTPSAGSSPTVAR